MSVTQPKKVVVRKFCPANCRYGMVYVEDNNGHDCPTCQGEGFVQGEPEVGDAATYGIGADRYPYTVVGMSSSGKTLTLKPSKFRRGVFLPDEDVYTRTATLRRDGVYRFKYQNYGSVMLGRREYSLDPHF